MKFAFAAWAPLSSVRRLTAPASAQSDRTALTLPTPHGDAEGITWQDLDRASNRFARLLARHGVDRRVTVVVGLPVSLEHMVVTCAAWKLGARVLALPSSAEPHVLPAPTGPILVVADWETRAYPVLRAADRAQAASLSDRPLLARHLRRLHL